MKSQDDKLVREKLVSRGAVALSDEELLSLVFGEGRDGETALALAREVLAANGLAALGSRTLAELRQTAGMGVRRAAVLASALELGRRAARTEADLREVIASDGDAERIFRPLLGALPHEEFWVAYLAPGNRVAEKARVSQGGLTATVVDHRLIVKRAVELLCPALVVVHNHPSGIAKPSAEDVDLTHRLETAASLFDIALVDHLIITRGECFSFRREGLIKK